MVCRSLRGAADARCIWMHERFRLRRFFGLHGRGRWKRLDASDRATEEPSYGTFQTNLLPSKAHADVTFAQMTYQRPDIEGMQAQMDTLKSDVESGKPVQMLITAYRALQKQYAHADSMLSLAYLYYATDVTQSYYRDEYAYLQSALGELDADMQGVSYALFESSSEAEAMAKESFGEDYVDSILQSDTLSDTSVQELSDQEEQLILQYDNLSSTFTLLDNGKRWTLSEIENDLSLSNDEYYRLYDAYCAELNRQAGDIFLQLVQIRSQIATKLDYANYSDYCYESYGRDYTPGDARELHAAVKQYIAPRLYLCQRPQQFLRSGGRNVFRTGLFKPAFGGSGGLLAASERACAIHASEQSL